MEKTATLNLRINPTVKNNAENVLKQLGIPMATAVDMFLRQISLTGSIPFSVKLPAVPREINADTMTNSELEETLLHGYEQIAKGQVVELESVNEMFRKK